MKGIPVALSGLAGFVDAIGVLSLGLFVSFMSGNSTLLGTGLVRGAAKMGLAAGLVACFVLGVACGSRTGRRWGAVRPAAVLLLVAGLLAAAAALHGAGWHAVAGLAAALAMGAENTVFQTASGLGKGLTYMTGTLARIGHALGDVPKPGRWRAIAADAAMWGRWCSAPGLGRRRSTRWGAAHCGLRRP